MILKKVTTKIKKNVFLKLQILKKTSIECNKLYVLIIICYCFITRTNHAKKQKNASDYYT